MKHQGKIVSRGDLMDYLWDLDLFVDDNTLTVNINRLRKKLELVNCKDYIQTRRGIGYIMP
jgi:DNA-binding response OmpR family regulator